MKTILRLLCTGIIIISFFSACSVEKRRYTSGYHIQWKNSKHNDGRNESARDGKAGGNHKISTTEASSSVNVMYDEVITASADHAIIMSNNAAEKINTYADILPEECDVIILKNGEEVKGKVTDITPDEIKYRKCDDLNGPAITLKRSEVFMIKYPNGTKDVIAQDAPSENKNKPAEKEDSGVFGILSMISILFCFLVPVVAFFLIPSAIILGAVGIGKKKKLRGLAMAGLILGIVFLLLIIISLASFSGH
jgi:hypothetical protein